MKKNCWEYMECGQGPDGDKVESIGICPAANEVRLNGVHGGKNAGRSCWVVSGTFCDDKIKKDLDHNLETCTACAFYKFVKQEEQHTFLFSGTLLASLMK